jgi:hypothetical protein
MLRGRRRGFASGFVQLSRVFENGITSAYVTAADPSK